jgi:hypothetical protein
MDCPSVVRPIFGAVLTIVTDKQQCDKIVAQSPIVLVPDVDIATGWTAHRHLSSISEIDALEHQTSSGEMSLH